MDQRKVKNCRSKDARRVVLRIGCDTHVERLVIRVERDITGDCPLILANESGRGGDVIFLARCCQTVARGILDL